MAEKKSSPGQKQKSDDQKGKGKKEESGDRSENTTELILIWPCRAIKSFCQ
jgi:hypothetical protein